MNQTLNPPEVQTEAQAVNPDARRTVPLWLTVKDVAKLLSIGVRTVWRMTANGQLPQPMRFNRKLCRWNRAALIEFAITLQPEEVCR